MSSTSDQVLKKFKQVADSVKNDLRKKGLVIPIQNKDGSITIDNYLIVKVGVFYFIRDRFGEDIVKNINLPQTAALIANSLALGKMGDDKIYKLDQEYGFGLFEIDLLSKHANRSLKRKDIDRADFLYTKLKITKSRVNSTKSSIMNSFEKLRNLH